ncbi:hypothetical protein FOPE_08611 [Fonsecaea pedrosoi]|nr:hypothetical protein FOPE_08611 [Fonsecaea pedrosoi]
MQQKIKCDMGRPYCGLCKKVGASCTFPVRQKACRGSTTSPKNPKRNNTASHINDTVDGNGSLHHQGGGDGFDRLTTSFFRVVDSNTLLQGSQESFTSEHQTEESAKVSTHSSSGQRDSRIELPETVSLPSIRSESPPSVRNISLDVQPPSSEFGSSIGHGSAQANEPNGWDIPDEAAVEIINQYFANIQPWLSILHRPIFHEEYMVTAGPEIKHLRPAAELGQAAVFMINGIFSLAARFSTHPYFETTPVQERGRKFARSATLIKDTMINTIEEPTLEFTKGCVLLAYHYITAGELAQGSMLTSICVHYAYDLGLDMVDVRCIGDDGSGEDNLQDVDAWVHMEDLRRLWWAIWELDAFVATISSQTFRINKSSEIKVFLPVSQDHWYSRQPILSSVLDHCPATAWKSLEGCPNQSPHAWCLVAKQVKSLLAIAAGRRHTKVSPTDIHEFETSVCCLKLALPVQFNIQSLYLDRDNFVDGLWIIDIHLMILASETFLARLHSSSPNLSEGYDLYQSSASREHRLRSYLIHIAQVWPSEYIPLTNPIMSCALVIPATLSSQQPEMAPTCLEVTTLVLSHMARYWALGHVVIREYMRLCFMYRID